MLVNDENGHHTQFSIENLMPNFILKNKCNNSQKKKNKNLSKQNV